MASCAEHSTGKEQEGEHEPQLGVHRRSEAMQTLELKAVKNM
jgi:hypothetical protein